MRRLKVLAVMIVMAAAASFAYTSVIEDKLPKCAGKWCRDIGCPADVLCVSGASVKTCAEVCGKN